MPKRRCLFLWLTALSLVFVAQGLAQLPEHKQLLYTNPLLQDGEDDFATMTNLYGQYTGTGWRSRNNARLVLQLKNRLPATGSIEFSMTQFDPRNQAKYGKQPVFTFTSRTYSSLAIFDEGEATCFMYLRTGTNYFEGSDRCGMEFDTGYEGLTTRDKERAVLMDKKWHPDSTYRFTFRWDHDHIWLLLNGRIIKQQLFKTPIERIRLISVGGDELYATLPGPVYSDLRVYTAETGFSFSDCSLQKTLAGITTKWGGHGLAVADVNLDGRDDILVTAYRRGECLRDALYIQQPDGGYLEQSAAAGLPGECGSFAALFFDLDNDGDPDLLTTSPGQRNRLYVNDGSGRFEEQGVQRGLLSTASQSGGAAAIDVNRDGALDLFIANINGANDLYLNDGTGVFTRTAGRADGQGGNAGLRFPSVVAVADVDGDGHDDLYITRREGANELFLGDGNGGFTEGAAARGLALNDTTQHSATFADYDNDGDMDLLCATGFTTYNNTPLLLRIFANDGNGHFTEVSAAVNIPMHGYSVQVVDANNDGYPDIYTAENSEFDKVLRNRLWTWYRSTYNKLFLGSAEGSFREVSASGADISAFGGRAALWHDFDQDGDLDLMLSANRFENVYLENAVPANGAHWAQISVNGPGGDYGGIGTKMYVYTPGHLGEPGYLLGHRQVVSQSGYATGLPLRQHFGLGGHGAFDVRLIRSDGSIIDKRNLAANQHHLIVPSASRLEMVSGDGQTGVTGERLMLPLVVRLIDGNDLPLSEVAVEWRILAGSGRFEGETLTSTNLSGQAMQWFICGETADSAIVEAHVTAADNSPIRFLIISERPPVSLSLAGGEGQSGIVGQLLSELLVVRATYPSGKSAAHIPVTFRILTGNGHLNGSSEVMVATDSAGLAGVQWTLGVQAGGQILRAECSDASIELTVTAVADVPYQLLSSGGETSGHQPGREFAEPFVAVLFDRHGNPVPGYPVVFSVRGGGHLRGEVSRTIDSDTTGRAQVFWTPGVYLGPEQALTAVATPPGASALQLQWQVAAIAVDAQRSTITATTPIAADGMSTSNIEVSLRDGFGATIGAGLTVHVQVSGSGNLLATADTLTDASGRVYYTLASTMPEHKILRAWIAGLNLFLSGYAVVEAESEPDLERSTLAVTTPVWADGVSRAEITVQVMDRNGLGVPGIDIELTASGSHNTLIQPALTDAQGVARGYLISTMAEEKNISAYLLPGRLPFAAEAQALFLDLQTTFEGVSGDRQETVVGRLCAEPVVVRLRSGAWPVAGRVVLFQITSGAGSFAGSSTWQAVTDSAGMASAWPLMGTTAGEVVISASADGAAPVFFRVYARADAAGQLIVLTGDNQSAPVGQSVAERLQVKAVDGYGNAVSGAAVYFSAPDGGNILSENPVLTDTLGMAECAVAVGPVEKTYHFRAALASGAAFEFTVTGYRVNHAPAVLAYLPETLRLNAFHGEIVTFAINHVVDSEGDSIQFVWLMDGVPLSTQSQFRIFANPTLPSFFTVLCLIHDRVDTSRLQWEINLEAVPLAVEVVHFMSRQTAGTGVWLSWRITAAEPIRHFYVLRSDHEHTPFLRLHTQPLVLREERVEFVDEQPPPGGVFFYQLEWIGTDGRSSFSTAFPVTRAVPLEITLLQNHPNPFNPGTTIGYTLDRAVEVEITIADLAGRIIRRLVAGKRDAGYHHLFWDGKNDQQQMVSSGVYLCRLTAAGAVWTRKMVFVK